MLSKLTEWMGFEKSNKILCRALTLGIIQNLYLLTASLRSYGDVFNCSHENSPWPMAARRIAMTPEVTPCGNRLEKQSNHMFSEQDIDIIAAHVVM